MRRSLVIDDAVFNFRIAGQLAVGFGVYCLFAPCGFGATTSRAPGTRIELLASLTLLAAFWLVIANHRLVDHYARVSREHHRCTKERVQLGLLNAVTLAGGSTMVAHLIFDGAAIPFVFAHLFSVIGPVYMIWQGSVWWREANRMDRAKHNHCPTCGYDLRASPTRCPECGTPAKSDVA